VGRQGQGRTTVAVVNRAGPSILLREFPRLKGKAAIAKLRELDSKSFPESKNDPRADDNLWRRIKALR